MIPPNNPQSSLNVLNTPFCGELRSKRFFMIDGLPSEESDFLDGSVFASGAGSLRSGQHLSDPAHELLRRLF